MSGSEKEITEQKAVPKKKRRWLKRLLYLVILLLVLVIVLYGTITSSWGIRELILPRIAASAGMKIQADEVDASLFKSRIALTGLKAERSGQFQFSGKKISCNFDLGAIMDGNIKLSNIRVDGVKGNLQITEKSKPAKPESSPSPPSTPPTVPPSTPKKPQVGTKSSPVTFDLRDVKLSDVDFELKMTGPSGERTFSLNQVNVAAERFTNGQDAKIVLTSLADITSGDELRLKGALDIDAVVNLGSDWKLNKLILNKTGIIGVSGKVGDTIITKRSLNLAADIAMSETGLKISKFNFSEVNGRGLSGIDLTADINFKPWKINAEISKGYLSNDLISSVAMIAAGVSPGNNQIDFGGKITTVNDNIKAALKLKITRSGNIVFNKHTYPLMPAVVNADTELLCNLKQERVKVGSFNVNVVSRGQKRLDLKLLEAYTLNRNAEKPGTLNLFMEARDIDLKFINMFASGLDLGGSFSAKLYIDLARLYKDIAVRGAWAVKGFSLKVPTWLIPQISVANKLDCSITGFKEFNITENTLKFYDGEKYQGEATLTGKYSLKSKAGQVKFRTAKLNSSFIRKFIFTPDNPVNGYITSLEPLTVNAATDLRLSAHRIVYKDTSLDFKQNDRDFVIAKVPDFKMLLQKPLAEIENTQCSLKINRLDLTWLNRFLPRDKCSFQQGQASFDGTATFGSSITDIKFAIKSDADKIYFKAPNGRFNDLNYKLETQGRWSQRYGLQQTSFDISLGQEAQQIARFKGDGSCVFPAGPLSFELSCNGLNQSAVNLFKPNALNRLNTDLKLNCLASAGFKKFSYSGHVALHNLRTKPETAPISGKLDLGGDGGLDFVTGTADLALNSISTKRQLANLNMKYKWPLVNSKKTGFINVDSSLIDMSGLRNVFAADRKAKKVDQKRSAYKKPQSKKPVEVKFDFGERGIKSQLNLKKILLAGNNKCSVSGNLFLRKKTFIADPLKLVVNDAPLNAKITMVSKPAGVAYKIKADSKGFDLAPFFKLLPVTEAQSSTGKLRDLALDIHGVGLHAPKLWDNMNGNLNIDLEDISIPYSFSNTWVGNVFFIPLNMMLQISKYLPVLAKSPRAMFSVNYFKDIVSSKYNIELEKSLIRLQSDNGEIKVNKCKFSGRKIGDFSFTGTMRLGTGDRLDLNSLYSFYGIDLPVRIYGTLEHPKTDSAARISTEFLRRNTLGILRGEGVGKIIKNSSKDLKQIFNNIRNGVKQEESDDSQNAPENNDNSSTRDRRKKLEENIKKSVNELIKLF